MKDDLKPTPERPWTRRQLLLGGAASLAYASTYTRAAEGSRTAKGNPHRDASTFLDLLRVPDNVDAFANPRRPIHLQRSGSEWAGNDIHLETSAQTDSVAIYLSAPTTRLTHLRIRWQVPVSEQIKILGDQWERSYGDLCWRSITPERVLPWYFLTFDDNSIHGYGIKTGAGALCFWQIDPNGVSLWLNVANGGEGVALGSRRLLAATVVSRKGEKGEAFLSAARQFCSRMCERPRLPAAAVYGSNDWYYAYGQNSAEQTLRDADLIAACSPAQGPRPFTVIDDGWTRKEAFPDMQRLAEQIRGRNVRPGIWIRPLQASADINSNYLLPSGRYGRETSRYNDRAFDPTIPEGLEAALAKVRQVVDWGYDLVKHDFTTYELLGRWGSEMGAQPTAPGWHFHDQSRTTAEIILDLYKAIRKEAGEKTLVIGCNTIGHLSAGLFEAQRTGDDVSGRTWERTRRMGVNTLAYRLPQNRSFFVQDADCVPITQDIPWESTKQWLDLIARSGTALLISPDPSSIGKDQKAAITEAFSIAATGPTQAEAVDWLQDTTPRHWKFNGREKKYDWYGQSGSWPFDI